MQKDLQANMPTDTELLTSVRDFLRKDIAEEIKGRKKFLNLVASNSLDILIRENKLGKSCAQKELDGLRSLLGNQGDCDANSSRVFGTTVSTSTIHYCKSI